MRIYCAGLLMLSSHAQNQWQDGEQIVATARQFIAETQTSSTQNSVLHITPPDRRLLLPICTAPLTAFMPANTSARGNFTIGVRCAGATPWQIFLAARREERTTVWVARRPLSKGEIINSDNVVTLEIPVQQLRGRSVSETEWQAGLRARLFIPANEAITQNNSCMVCKGDVVKLSTGEDAFSVSVMATALNDAGLQQKVSVMNPSSRRTIAGTVIAPGQVRAGLGASLAASR